MTNVVQLGPLMFAADRLLAVALLLAFTVALGKIGERTGRETTKAGMWSLLAGIVTARLAYIVAHLDSYSQDWWTALALWQGGFNEWAGMAVAAAVLVVTLGINRTSGSTLAVMIALALSWAGGEALLRAPSRPLPEMPILARLDGGRIEPGSLAGTPHVINLWATWCPPCRRELPMLAEVASNSEVPILLVNEGETAGQVERYLAESGVPPDNIALDERGALMRTIEGGGLPTTLFINARGEVVDTHLGEISRAALLDQINRLKEE